MDEIATKSSTQHKSLIFSENFLNCFFRFMICEFKIFVTLKIRHIIFIFFKKIQFKLVTYIFNLINWTMVG